MAYFRYPHSGPSTPQAFWDIAPSEHDTPPQPITPLVTHYSTPEEQEQQAQFEDFLRQQQQQPPPPPQQQHLQQPQPTPQQQPDYQHPPTIQLQERPVYSAQYRFDNITQEEFRQQQAAVASDDRKAETSGSRRAASKPPLHISTTSATSRASVSPGASSSGAGPSSAVGPARHTRSVTASAHPYRRPHSAAAGRGTPRVSSDPVARLHRVTEVHEPEPALFPAPVQAPLQHVPPTRPAFANASPATSAMAASMSVVCPAMSLWRDRVLRPSTAAGSGPSAPKRYTICADLQFDAAENVLVAMFELPGVKKADVRIALASCPVSRARQLTVSGTARRARAPERGHAVCERRAGEFARSIGVPPDTQPHDVHATMEDGVLTLRIPGGQPTQALEPQDVLLV